MEALVSTGNLFAFRPLNDGLSSFPLQDIKISTERLKKRLLEEGLGESLVNNCEQIMLSDFSEIKGQLSVLCEERSSLLDILRQLEVTTSIYNLILGKVYCDHHGTMEIRSNRQYSCKLKFKEQSIVDRNPRQVNGFVEDASGKKVATLFGKWGDSMYYISGDRTTNVRGVKNVSDDAHLLWKRVHPPPNLTRLRPDQRHLENGEYEKANGEKLRLERRQRMSSIILKRSSHKAKTSL